MTDLKNIHLLDRLLNVRQSGQWNVCIPLPTSPLLSKFERFLISLICTGWGEGYRIRIKSSDLLELIDDRMLKTVEHFKCKEVIHKVKRPNKLFITESNLKAHKKQTSNTFTFQWWGWRFNVSSLSGNRAPLLEANYETNYKSKLKTPTLNPVLLMINKPCSQVFVRRTTVALITHTSESSCL